MPQPMQVLIVDDEETICEALCAWLTKEGYRVQAALSGAQALALLEEQYYDLFLLDIKMPGMDGLELLAKVREKQSDAVVIMITAHGSIQTAVEAMKRGASDYLCKPFDPEELTILMERLAATKILREENRMLREQLQVRAETLVDGFVAQSEAMRGILSMIEDVAPSAAPILIVGETGVGKDLVAKAIHMRSGFAAGPFIAINCGALTESLLESELFGHEQGAFTGAVKARRGRLEMANNGTLFLDEVGEISSKMQVALLRALEEKRFQRLGGSQLVDITFRLICATHRDLRRLIRENLFREDFFYRINVFTIDVPPLRERPEDIPVLADFFLERFTQDTGKRIEGLTQKAIHVLMDYPWPGNVRELRNVIERAVVIAHGRMIGAQELDFLQARGDECDMAGLSLEEMEARHIQLVFESCGGNVSQTARRLGIDRGTLARKLKRYKIAPV